MHEMFAKQISGLSGEHIDLPDIGVLSKIYLYIYCTPYFSPDLPSSRASREMPRTPRSAHNTPVMQAIRTLQRNPSRFPKI